MANNAIQKGDRITYLNTGSAILSGDVVEVEDRVFVALVDIGTNESGELATFEVYQVTKTSGEAMLQGKKVYWNNTQGIATHIVSTNKLMGTCWTAAASAALLVNVQLHP